MVKKKQQTSKSKAMNSIAPEGSRTFALPSNAQESEEAQDHKDFEELATTEKMASKKHENKK